MKTIKKSIMGILFIGMIITLSGCKKEVGPQGETGAQGPAGSSNVTVQNISISPGNWNTSNMYNLYFNTSVSVPTTDACLVYISTDNSVYRPLPSMAFYQNGDQFSFNYSSQYNLQITYYNPNGAAGKITHSLYFKIINIPPAGLIKKPDLDLNDYQSVKEAFNL